jgi:hypothetical protein
MAGRPCNTRITFSTDCSLAISKLLVYYLSVRFYKAAMIRPSKLLALNQRVDEPTVATATVGRVRAYQGQRGSFQKNVQIQS